MRASVVVVVWNGERYLRECLDSLAAELGPDDEMIVVDNASADGSARLVRTGWPGARLIQNERNLGYAGGCNIGLRAGRGRVLILANQDMAVHKGWLEALVETLDDEQIGIAGSKLLFPDGRIQHVGGNVEYPLALPALPGRGEPDHGQWDAPRDVDYVMGASLALRRDVLERLGGLDEGFSPAFYEDTDLCYRARAAGWRVRYQPHSVATHHETSSVVREGAAYHRWMGRGRLRFVLKHWTLAQFLGDFVPAERTWLRQVPPGPMRQGLRDAYLDTILSLQTMPRSGVLREEDALETVADRLIELRSALVTTPKTAPEVDDARWQVEEQPFRSRVPLIGRLIVAFREGWNRVSTKWYVRPLVEQQNRINLEIAARLEQRREELEAVHALLASLDREATEDRVAWARAVGSLHTRIERLERKAMPGTAASLGSDTEGDDG